MPDHPGIWLPAPQRFMVGLHARKLCPLQPDQLRGSGKLFAGWPEANLKAGLVRVQMVQGSNTRNDFHA